MFEAIAIFLDGGNVIADRLGASNISPQKILLRYFLGAVLGCMRGGRKLPAVGRQGDIREDEESHAPENTSFPRCEIATHQLLE